MADFVPKTGIDSGAPNWTGASRQPDKSLYRADTSFEALFSGAGQAIAGAANAAYTGIVERIKDDWRGQLDPVRDAQGVGDVTDAATVGLKHPAGTPPQMTSFEERASKLSQAHSEGRIGDAYYYAQLNAMSKEMRSKYPGFRDEVDAVIQKTTGVVPANALRNAVLAQLEATRSAQDKAAQNDRTYALQNEKHWTPAMRERMAATGQLPSVQELSPIVSANEGRARLVQSARAEMELDEANGKQVAGRAVDQFHSETRDVYGQVFSEAVKKLDTAVGQTLGKGAAMSAGDLQQVTGAVQALEMELQNSIDKVLNGVPEGRSKSLAQLINDSDKIRKMREDALAPIQRIKEAIANKDFGLAQANARALAAYKDQKSRQLIERYDHLQTIAGLKQVGGEQFISQILAIPGGPEVMSGILGTVRDVFEPRMAAGKATLKDYVDEAKRNGGGAKTYREIINRGVTVLANPETPSEIRKNISASFFNPESLNAFKKGDRPQVYRMLASPEVSKQMIALKDTQPEVFTRYSDWIMKSFFQVHQQLGSDVNSIGEDKAFTAKFNPATNQFEPALTPYGMRLVKPRMSGALVDPMEAARRYLPGASGLLDSVNEMNKNIKVLEPIMKAKGLDVGTEMDKLFRIQGVLPDAPKKKGWLEMLEEGVKGAVSKTVGEVKDQINKENEAISGFFGGTSLNFQQASGATEGTGSQASLNRSEVESGTADIKNLQPRMKKFIDDLAEAGIVDALEVRSGYRDPERNRRAGGARYSRHIQGDAIDLDVSGMTDEQKAAVLEAAIAKGAKGIGVYPGGNSLHIDLRETPATWGYSPFGKYRGVDWRQQPSWAHGSLKKLFGAS